MDRSETAIIIPAFNEEKTIYCVVSSVIQYGTVIVVDDHSEDTTAQKALTAGALVVTHGKNTGYDGALNTGFAKSVELKCQYAITFDADGQHDCSQIEKYITNLTSGKYQFVIGIRPRFARISEKIFGIVSLIKWGIKDPLCGMKGYHLNLYKDRGYFDSYNSIGTELSLYAAKKGYSMIQIKIPIHDRADLPRFGISFKAEYKIIMAMIKGLIRY